MLIAEDIRAARLLDAQSKAEALFREIEERQLLRPGVTERALNTEVRELAREMYGVTRYWHKRIVRSGPNTLLPYRENPPDRMIDADDIAFFDLGPIFSEWEADFGRTYVLGDDPRKLRLRDDLEDTWHQGKAYFDEHPDVTGAELYARVCELAAARGWEHGGSHAGHLVGEFPHERILGEEESNYIMPGNPEPLRTPDSLGQRRHWILEVHLVDRAHEIGAFFEQLLTSPQQPPATPGH